MVSFKKYIAEAKSKEELEKYEKNYENIFGKSKSSKEDDSTPEPKVSTENPPEEEEEEEEDEIGYEDINIDEKHNESGKLGKSFNNNIIFLNEKKNTSTAEKIKSFFKSGNPFLDGKGSLNLFHIGDESVEYKGNTYAITTIKPKTSREKAASFFKEFKSHEDIDFFIALYTVLRNKGVFEKSSIKILNHYLPKEFLNNEILEKIRSVISSEAIEYQSNKKMIYPKSGGANKNFSLFSYIVLYHLLPDITKTTKQNQFKEEIQGIPSSANVRVPEFYTKRKIETNTEEKEDLKVDDGKRGSSNNVEIIKKSEEHNSAEDEDNIQPKDKEDLKPNVKSLKDKDIRSDIFSRKSYYEATQEEVEEEFNTLKKYINQQNILKELKGETKSEIFSYSMKDVDTVVKDLMSNFSKEEWEKKKEYIKNIKLYGGKITGPISRNLTDYDDIVKKTDNVSEDVNYRKIDKKVHNGRITPEMASKINVKNAFEYFDNYTKGIKSDIEKRADYIVNKFTKEASKRLKKAEDKLNRLNDVRKTIKNYNEADYLNDIGYNLNSAKTYLSEMAKNLNNLLKNYKETVLTLVGTTTLEKQRIDKIMSNKKEFKVLENRAKERASEEQKNIDKNVDTVTKIKTFSSETKDAVKNTIDRVQLKKKFDEVKKEFSQKKTISANIKDRMTNFIKKLAEKPSTVETAKIMLDRNRPKTQQTTQPTKKPGDKAVNESVFYLTEDELSSNIANKTAELFKPHKLANDKIFINLRKAVNAGDKDAFVKPLVEIKNTLLSGNSPSITILTYADGMINFMNTVITKIDDLDDKMTDEEYKDVISAVNALNSFIETGLTNLQNQLEKSFSAQPQQEQPENIPANAKAALTTETGEEDEEKSEEESEEENEEPKNLLALAKKKFRSNK